MIHFRPGITRHMRASSPLGQSIAFIRGLNPRAWYRYGHGITAANSLVSQWDDQSGNGNHQVQATDTNKPTLEADSSITFDGSDNYLQATFTFAQPMTLYALCKQITWTSADPIISGAAGATRGLVQRGSTPSVGLNYGSGVIAVPFTLETWGVLAAVVTGAGSSVQLNQGTPGTGNPGANSMDGITLAGNAVTPTVFGNVAFKEVIAFNAAHDAATRFRVISYLMQLGGI